MTQAPPLSLSADLVIPEYAGLVHAIAQTYKNKGVDCEDLVQQGYLGLLEALRRYDPDQGAKFATYAVFWIKKHILAALQKEYAETESRKQARTAPTPSPESAVPTTHNRLVGGSPNLNLPPGLPRLERRVILLSYRDGKTLREIAALTGLSAERVRQLRQKALRRLKKAGFSVLA